MQSIINVRADLDAPFVKTAFSYLCNVYDDRFKLINDERLVFTLGRNHGGFNDFIVADIFHGVQRYVFNPLKMNNFVFFSKCCQWFEYSSFGTI